MLFGYFVCFFGVFSLSDIVDLFCSLIGRLSLCPAPRRVRQFIEMVNGTDSEVRCLGGRSPKSQDSYPGSPRPFSSPSHKAGSSTPYLTGTANQSSPASQVRPIGAALPHRYGQSEQPCLTGTANQSSPAPQVRPIRAALPSQPLWDSQLEQPCLRYRQSEQPYLTCTANQIMFPYSTFSLIVFLHKFSVTSCSSMIDHILTVV